MRVGAHAVPAADPGWDYQGGQDGRRRHNRLEQRLPAGMKAASNKAVNYDKLREIVQNPDENPAMFLNRLTEALTQCTRLDPASQAGATVLATHFISQSAPDTPKKLKKAEEGPQTPISDLVKMAFNVFCFFKILFIYDRHRERGRDTEAGSMPGARRGTRSRVSRIAPWAKGRR